MTNAAETAKIAYHNDAALRKDVIAQMAAHREADELVKGKYWEDGKGCAVGCLLKSGNHIEYESKFGIPVMLAWLEDCFFEGLPNGKSQAWPERFLGAIKPGQDLSLVGWKFLYWLQTENLKQAKKKKMPADVIKTIKQCADVIAHLTKGSPVNESAAWEAAESAWSAARLAEWAAYEKMSDKLIELIKKAPMAKA